VSRFLTKILNEPPGGRSSEQDGLSDKDRPSQKDAASTVDRPPTVDSPAVTDSLSVEQPPPPPAASLTIVDSPAREVSPSTKDSPNLLSVIPDVRGHMQLPHRYTDHLPRWLSPDEQAVYLQLYRLSWGWGRDVCFISNPKLAERSGVPETSMRRAVKKLIGKGLIEKTDRRFGGTEQGIEYRVFSMDRPAKSDRASTTDSPSTGTPNKERIKENLKADASRCPDCMGTGFYYPEGTAKGVKRCEHRKLR
jgi:helix-turn-helix protein